MRRSQWVWSFRVSGGVVGVGKGATHYVGNEGRKGYSMSRAMSLNDARDAGFAKALPAPDGQWVGQLVAKAWGQSVNLVCFFKHMETGEIHRCVAFRNSEKQYTPKDGVVDFSEEGIEGRVYLLKTGLNSKGNPAWHSASLHDVSPCSAFRNSNNRDGRT